MMKNIILLFVLIIMVIKIGIDVCEDYISNNTQDKFDNKYEIQLHIDSDGGLIKTFETDKNGNKKEINFLHAEFYKYRYIEIYHMNVLIFIINNFERKQ